MSFELKNHRSLHIRQMFEAAELFGFETRNKYVIETDQQIQIGFAAEQQKGFFGFLFRQMLGHWRTFEIFFFNMQRQIVFRARHPFRFFFQRLEVAMADGRLVGAIQQRFSILTKKFDVQDASGNVLMTVRSPFWRIWTFTFKKHDRDVAVIQKKWSGILTEAFTDKDRFHLQFGDPGMPEGERTLLLACAIFIDLKYFEKKAQSKSSPLGFSES